MTEKVHLKIYSVRRTSAFTPMVYFCMVTIPSFLMAAIWMPDLRIKALYSFAALFVALAAVVAYFFLAFTHPETLRGERMAPAADQHRLGDGLDGGSTPGAESVATHPNPQFTGGTQ